MADTFVKTYAPAIIRISDLTNIAPSKFENMYVEYKHGGSSLVWFEATYLGSGALTLADYNAFPIGSRIFDFQSGKIHLKTGATSWVSIP